MISLFFFFGQEFPYDYEEFKEFILDLDRRLASIACQAFEDCSGLESVFKVVSNTMLKLP